MAVVAVVAVVVEIATVARINSWRTMGLFTREVGLWNYFFAKTGLWDYFALYFIIFFNIQTLYSNDDPPRT